jgi:SNF2-related domain
LKCCILYVECVPGHNVLLQTAPNLSHFMWWRLVCDEAHELVSYEVSRKGVTLPSDGLKKLVGFQSRFRWYVTGTPFPKGIDSLRGALKVSLQWFLIKGRGGLVRSVRLVRSQVQFSAEESHCL